MNTRFFLPAAILALTFAMISCNSDEDGGSMNASNISLDPLETEVNEVSNMFAGRLLNAASAQTPDENLAFSPLSMQMALSMLANGADSETYTELASGIGFDGMDIASVNSYNSKLIKVLPSADKKVDMAIANSVWVGDKYPIYKEFTDACVKAFKAEVKNINLQDGDATVKAVNQWISDNTRGKIKDLMDRLDDPENTACILANALYFKGSWKTKFDKVKTKMAPFYNFNGSESNVEMMYGGKAKFKYLENGRFVCLSMPYGNGSFSFDILYPSMMPSSDAPENTINDAEEWLKNNTIPIPSEFRSDAVVNMPKFKIETKFDGTGILSQMGITRIFNLFLADFSKMCENQCYVSKVLQGCNIAVDEAGAEAAAATVVVMETFYAYHPGDSVSEFTIDHPFIYMIRENSTGAILFMGKMVKM